MVENPWRPELLAPAKNLERLQVAVSYGADAVYLGGQRYGLRARADNFTEEELRRGVAFAHERGAKIYVTLNAFLHDEDLDGLEEYCALLEACGVDAVIVSDLGVLRRIRRCSGLAIHLSTQASCLNVHAARLWKAQGVKRIIVGRELSIAEAGEIRREADIEVEMFVHGAMCMAYSGHCTISNFTAGRDSNRGGCSQSCRHDYSLQPISQQSVRLLESPPDVAGTGALHSRPVLAEGAPASQESSHSPVPFMSSKDLAGVERIADFFRHQICSVKIEGRMKSSFYVATTCRAYRLLLDAYAQGTLDEEVLAAAQRELLSVPHRDYTAGSLQTPAGPDSVFLDADGISKGEHEYLGLVLAADEHRLAVRLFAPLAVGAQIEVLPFAQEPVSWCVRSITSVQGEPLLQARRDSVICLSQDEIPVQVQARNVLRSPASHEARS